MWLHENAYSLMLIVSFISQLNVIFQKFVVLGWVIGPLLLISMIFGPTKKELSPLEAVLYTGLGKSVWSLGIAWFIIACATGRGGIVNRVLSAKCLIPYSRMTYTAYLINPLCIMFIVMSSEAPMHLDFLSLVSRILELPPKKCVSCTKSKRKKNSCAEAIHKLVSFLFSWYPAASEQFGLSGNRIYTIIHFHVIV